MSKTDPAISDLKASDLVDRCGLSRSYASELVNRLKTPSLEVAVKIEQEFGVPAATWLTDQRDAAA
jgi:transcriptional regulator with XRE-family HTH domain